MPKGDDRPLLAPDTNLLAYETSRRMLHGIALETGYAIAVLPEVFIETERRVVIIAQQGLRRRLAHDRRYDNATKQRIAAAAGAATKAWLEEQLDQGGVYVRLTETLHQTWRSLSIMDHIPPGIVKSNLRTSPGDAMILAQAVAFDVTLLSTNNLNTIHHIDANKWAQQLTGSNRQLLYTPDEILDELSQDNENTLYAWTTAYGMRPPENDEAKCRDAYEAALNRVYGAGFESTSRRARWRYEHDATFMASLHSVRQRAGVAAAAASEARRQDMVSQAITKEGWTPQP